MNLLVTLFTNLRVQMSILKRKYGFTPLLTQKGPPLYYFEILFLVTDPNLRGERAPEKRDFFGQNFPKTV